MPMHKSRVGNILLSSPAILDQRDVHRAQTERVVTVMQWVMECTCAQSAAGVFSIMS